MRIQLAYRYTGEDPEEITAILKKILRILEERNHNVYCPVLDPERPKEKKELYLNTLKKIEETDCLLVLIKSNDKSEGMLMEIGYAMGKNKKIIAAIKQDVQTHLRDLADEVIEFQKLEDLYEKLEGVK